MDDTNPPPDQSRWSLENAASLAGVVSSLGVATFLVVIIGRLWTTTYFEHFGLPSSSLEFSVYDYAFRSLEALISLVLGAIAFSAAWLNRQWLRERGSGLAILELTAVVLLLLWVFVALPYLPDGWCARTTVLGLSGGAPLAAMIWFALDVFEGPGDPTRSRLASWMPIRLGWKVAGVVFLLAVGFGYLPVVSEKLATMEATAGLATGKLPSAVLEADTPLPPDIASDADPTKSVKVRIVLGGSENTYVLHSTQCTTIGQLDVTTRVEPEGEYMPPEGPDVCRVFAIPTARLKSVEYIKVSGKAAPNESRAHAVEVGLDQEFSESVSTKGASDEEDEDEKHRLCKEKGGRLGPRFYNSVWYSFAPSTDGAVFARVETPDFKPVIGLWEELESLGALKPVTGSDQDTGLACETDVRRPDSDAPTAVVGTIAQVQGGARYVAAVAAQEDNGGDVRVSFEFFPGATFRALPAAGATRPPGEKVSEVLGVSNMGGEVLTQATTATLELWEFDLATYKLRPLVTGPKVATLATADGDSHDLIWVSQHDEEPPTRLEVQLCQVEDDRPCSGPSYVGLPASLVGLARFSMSVVPPVVLCLEGTAKEPLRHTSVQAALLLVLRENEIRDTLGYGGEVIFDPPCYDDAAHGPAKVALDESAVHGLAATTLLEDAGYADGFAIQIEVQGEGQLLAGAAEIVRKKLVGIGLDPSIGPCADACVRVYFGTPEE